MIWRTVTSPPFAILKNMKLYKYLKPELDKATGELIFRSPMAGTLWHNNEMSRHIGPAYAGIYACELPEHSALEDYADQGVLVTLEGWGDCQAGENGVYTVEYAKIVDYDPGEAYAYILRKGGCPLSMPADAEALLEHRRPDLINRWRGQRAVTIALQHEGSNILRSAACGDPEAAFLYAYLIDGGPSDETRAATCAKPETALIYADLVDGGYHPLTWAAMLRAGIVLTTAYQHAVDPVSDYPHYQHARHQEVLYIPKPLALQITVRLTARWDDRGRIVLTPDGERRWLLDNTYIWPDISLDLHRGAPLAYDVQHDDSVMCRAEIWGTLMLDTLYRDVQPRYIASCIRLISFDASGLRSH